MPRFKYSFFIQNIEEVSFPIPFRVNIRDRRTSAADIEPLEVKVYAGPKHVVGGSLLSCTPHKTGVRESFLVFEKLPPFDTWRLDCETQSTWVELEIDTGDENRFIRKRLIVDLYPRRLALQAGHASSTLPPPSTCFVNVSDSIGWTLLHNPPSDLFGRVCRA